MPSAESFLSVLNILDLKERMRISVETVLNKVTSSSTCTCLALQTPVLLIVCFWQPWLLLQIASSVRWSFFFKQSSTKLWYLSKPVLFELYFSVNRQFSCPSKCEHCSDNTVFTLKDFLKFFKCTLKCKSVFLLKISGSSLTTHLNANHWNVDSVLKTKQLFYPYTEIKMGKHYISWENQCSFNSVCEQA